MAMFDMVDSESFASFITPPGAATKCGSGSDFTSAPQPPAWVGWGVRGTSPPPSVCPFTFPSAVNRKACGIRLLLFGLSDSLYRRLTQPRRRFVYNITFEPDKALRRRVTSLTCRLVCTTPCTATSSTHLATPSRNPTPGAPLARK